ncbi:hypothetical protein FCV25MIE_09445 [Fagus crenata]
MFAKVLGWVGLGEKVKQVHGTRRVSTIFEKGQLWRLGGEMRSFQRGSVGFHWVPRRIVGGFHNRVKGEGRVRIEVPWLVGRWNTL